MSMLSNSSNKLHHDSFKLLIYVISILFLIFTASAEQASSKDSMAPQNVFKQPLALFSRQPMTGFHRDGYCRTGAADFGNHAVAGIVTEEFLDFTASQGNDLRSIGGMQGGCKWCLCTGRWFEAYQAYKDGRIGKGAVPTVDLHATEDSALRKVDMEVFKEFAANSDQKREL